MATNKEEEEYETDAYQGQLNPELANMLQVRGDEDAADPNSPFV